MKPTQQEIIAVAREHATRYTNRHYPDKPVFTFTQDALQKVIELALERFGAGGGEPVAYVCPTSHVTADGSMEDGPDYLEWADEASDYEKRVGTPLYTHPSPTDLRAEYLRGLEDAANVCDEVSLQANAAWKLAYKPQDQGREMGADECADAIRSLKDKQ